MSVKSALETWAKSTKYVLCACTMFELKKKWNLRIYVYFESKKRMRKGGRGDGVKTFAAKRKTS